MSDLDCTCGTDPEGATHPDDNPDPDCPEHGFIERYKIRRGPSGWKVIDTETMVHGIPTLHKAVGKPFFKREDAQAEADRLNKEA